MTAELFPLSPETSGDSPLAQPPVADRQGALDALEQRYPGLWRAGQLGHLGRAGSVPALPTGHDALSAELPGGGWPVGALTELLLADPGVGELRLLRPALLLQAYACRREARAVKMLHTQRAHARTPAQGFVPVVGWRCQGAAAPCCVPGAPPPAQKLAH